MGEVTNLKKNFFVSVLIVMCFFGVPAQAKFGGGSGTAEDPYLIFDANQMNAIGANSGDWNKHFKLMNNIDLSGFDGLNGNPSFNIIGNKSNPFLGVFDGNRHTIANLTYNEAAQQDIGLFGYVTGSNAHIKYLGLIAPEINALTGDYHHVGALVGHITYGARITDCYVEDCVLRGYGAVGGLLGNSWAQTTLSNCYSTGTVISTGFGVIVGGLVGGSKSTISNCYSTANVSGDVFAGGLTGHSEVGTISSCYSSGSVFSTSDYVGGLIGFIYDGTVINSYSTGSVKGSHGVGGLIGHNNLFTRISKCYSSGSVIGTSSVGGLVGSGGGTVEASFWDIETSGQTSSNGGTGKTTEEMQTESTFTDAGWDFVTRIWKMCDGPYYPRLWWEICPVRPVYYVDADANGTNDGSSWANACTNLDHALYIARYGDEIHVAQGTYKPVPLTQPPPPPTGDSNYPDTTVTDSNRTATFQLKNGVVIKGGFAGLGESNPNARNISAFETILSGDFAGNDREVNEPRELLTDPCRADNSYHVVTINSCDKNTVLDGFTITTGNANGTGEPNDRGGGIFNSEGSPIVTNCRLIENSAAHSGGGMCNEEDSKPMLINCTSIRNSAGFVGGGMHNYDSSPTLINCTFTVNRAEANGGGMLNEQWSHATLTNCILWGGEPNEIFDEALSSTIVTYSNVHGGWPGKGNIDADPCFADADNGDCHLKSEAGRWDPDSQTWVQDDVNSPCIDAGDPNSDWRGELWPHGKRINMGAYGGTAEASMSLSDADNIADLNFDGLLCYQDMKLFTDKWLFEAVLLPEDLSRDGIVNSADFAIFAHYFELPARHPNPGDGVRVVSTTADLSWTAGRGATSHDVYFGTSSPPPFIQNQAATTFDPGTMDYITTYYWRIDSVNAYGTFTGVVWSFTTTGGGPG